MTTSNYLDCPIPWCTGYRDDHGGQPDALDSRTPAERGYPADPAAWQHHSPEQDFPGVGYGFWEATASEPPHYVLASGDRGVQLAAHSPAELDALSSPDTIAALARAGRLADLVTDRATLASLGPAEIRAFPRFSGMPQRENLLTAQALTELRQLSDARTLAEIAGLVATASSTTVAELDQLAQLVGDPAREEQAVIALAALARSWALGHVPA